MKIVAKMGHWSSVVGGGVLLACTELAAAAFWIANDIHIGPEDEGRDIYDMALAIRDDARAALKGDSDE